ncbi:hypothetical protein [Geodermatophilus normandii]|uniref:hypothetical protein n=1 Tax=Geodermatophilus normandii TaxID=1137989 RepID=UPI001EF7E038|nr:hypothetical protein [Geodermatophilus normandii]
MDTQRDTAVSVTGLRKAFGSTVVLDGLDLAVAEGSVYALLGPTAPGRRPPSTSCPRSPRPTPGR